MNTLSILIVDDDKIILQLLTLGFEKCGFRVFTAENGYDAWSLFNNDQTSLVLTDIYMPGLDGKELSRRIRNMSPLAKIALMTGSEIDEEIRELLSVGTVDYLFLKPFNIKKICNTLIADAEIN
jgi:DNA-binding response OmpR family regulator